MGTPVVNNAMLQCSMGAAPSTLSILPFARTDIDGQPVAIVTDILPMVNIKPFGVCSSLANPVTASLTAAALGVLTPGPCIPLIAGPWSPGAKKMTVMGIPAVTDSSTCKCSYLGEVKITFSGVVTATTA